MLCTIEGCLKKSVCRGMCHMHYSRWQRHGDPHKLVNPWGSVEERFWRHVEKTDGCWNWTGFLNWAGYGRLSVGNRKMRSAHRLSFEMHGGEIPRGMVVMHTCDNPACVNPGHLLLGTMKDNTQDMLAKGRGNHRCPQGEGNPNNKLTADQAREAKFGPAMGSELARRFGVSQTTISDIRKGRIWGHLTP